MFNQPMTTKTIHTHPLLPFTPLNARVMMLGSFPPPPERWKMPFYYPNYNNDMWRILGLVFFGDAERFIDKANKTFYQDEIEKFLVSAGIAIGDTAYQVIRQKDNASDQFLQIITPTDIESILRQLPQCHAVITTGEKATEVLCQQFTSQKTPKIGEQVQLLIANRCIDLYRLPSSSRAYPLAIDKKADVYRQVFDALGLLT
ncbi:uracil-DNA glycosylase family protein [Moraxella catarrhalis]|uniref:G:T/U mismatch-specific uracil/thymine DNA-glycosylase n=1 Tax=Moraxella catarrhalis TaxID=480 RepID=A0A198UE58_MORCA|nr:uracil-DNA glycosylase family protein [Moraxella catarrhalis]OAU94368.1 G:T/U mismatch-specific uracil/thymine DNA-glycosylase [Moraxella catarrhalis]OAU94664.1 G:T/U mismatch-specific uracil/thymine DNA-glycosylase [Moraxella catarrhalis]OAU97036.1 G:T/U mismatch-specific uracil/thymine DNA-glycosylase [Moraxella catarrhalis]